MAEPAVPTRSLHLSVGDAHCLPELRRWLRTALGDDDVEIDAELVCTELVANAVEHGGGLTGVRIDAADPARVRVEVDDRGGATVPTVGRSRLGAHRGHGLTIIDTVAEWGVTATPTGKTVWAVLPR